MNEVEINLIVPFSYVCIDFIIQYYLPWAKIEVREQKAME